jgi:hypothetical protein
MGFLIESPSLASQISDLFDRRLPQRAYQPKISDNGHLTWTDASDENRHRYDTVQVFDRAGPLLLNFGGSGARPGEFWLANGVAISRTNEIYVADAYNRRVQVFRYVGGQP